MSVYARTFVSVAVDRTQIGARLSELRGSLTQVAFAARLGVASKTVARWEAGEVVPDGPSLLALLKEFGADPVWLLTGDGSSPRLTGTEALLVSLYRRADADGRQAIQATAAALVSRGGPPSPVSRLTAEDSLPPSYSLPRPGEGSGGGGHHLLQQPGAQYAATPTKKPRAVRAKKP